MEAVHLSEWIRKLQTSRDSGERRVLLRALEPVLDGMARAEREILFPVLERFLGFREWMQEARSHQKSFRELLETANLTSEHERLIEISDEFVARLTHYLDSMERILYPRLVQTLPRLELLELRMQLGGWWMFREIEDRAA